ncbi:PIN domain-like protein [Exidia glandulosa HHB12029]|uniref:PIN domain-like protein n=1 Tax=Exidia glandulosa HHB12029 TaxID=1314781 RepID=A0A165K1X7_EXIGL|nr:PIN domain-like protein [Exidia glandulosa HHB12029]
MGIQGLLPFLAPIQQQAHLRDFVGKTIGVDGYVWLHRGAYACATEIVTGKTTTKYVDFAMQRVRLMQHYGVSPYLVFDGGPLPAKVGTEEKRKQAREESKRQATALAAAGKESQARELYAKCLDVTPQMAFQFIKALRAAGVPYVVAPYEADAQLIHLERTRLIDGILTEDSDLLVFGCNLFLSKLDASGTVVSISRPDFARVVPGWTDKEFREMAMLAGCDYLESIPGMGVKTAWKMMKRYRNAEKVVQIVRFEGKLKPVPRDYLQNFRIAELAFLYQRVYDPLSERLVHLEDPPPGALDGDGENFVGR